MLVELWWAALVQALWRRSQRTRFDWTRMDHITTRCLPPPEAGASAVIQHAGICTGARKGGPYRNPFRSLAYRLRR
ncbi:MAG: hypothetical protein ACREXR_23045 [Gammaproteobacteria bacterium]